MRRYVERKTYFQRGVNSAIDYWITEINHFPSADVVPKSEVDRLVDKWIGEENLTQDAMVLRFIEALRDEAKRYEKYYFNHEYDKLIAEAKQEVAREIFEEIEKYVEVALMNGHIETPILCIGHGTFAELKKKYTEIEGE